MSGFSFPPPPPPPPQTVAPESQPHSYRGAFSQRGPRGRGRGSSRGGNHRGGHPGQDRSSNPQQHYQNRSTGQFSHQTPQHAGHSLQLGHRGPPSQSPSGVGSSNTSQQAPLHSPDLTLSHKRTHNQAFNDDKVTKVQAKAESKPKMPAAPMIPSFGFTLPTASLPATSREVAPPDTRTEDMKQKSARKKNALGLTPKGDVHEDNEDVIDEEAAFAQSGSSTVSYRGRSIQLNTAADVAAWIAERKKRYPTTARVAARKATQDAAREQIKAAREAEKKRRLEERETALRVKKRERNHKKISKSEAVKDDESEVLLSSRNGPTTEDPLARIAQLEEQLRQAREALLNPSGGPVASNTLTKTPQDEDTPVTLKTRPDLNVNEESSSLSASITEEAGNAATTSVLLGIAYSSADDLDDVDAVSEISSDDPSSDSQSSDLESEVESDSDAPPDEESSHRQEPARVAPPARAGPNKSQVCYAFANTGRCRNGDQCMRSHDVPCRFYAKHGHCRYGDKCRMSHDVTPRTGKKGTPNQANKTKTMSLRERMVEQELREEAKIGVQIVKQLGDNGFFAA